MEVYKPKDPTKEPIVSVGDIVLLTDDQSKRSFWKLCRIVELLPGPDGKVRSAKVCIASSEDKFENKVLCRPLKLFVPMEVPYKSDTQKVAKLQPLQTDAPQHPVPTQSQVV